MLGMQKLLDDLMHSTVRLETIDPMGGGSGTGFIFHVRDGKGECFPAIITNKHVISGAEDCFYNLTAKTAGGLPELGSYKQFRIRNCESNWIVHPDPDIDLAMHPIGRDRSGVDIDVWQMYYVPILDSFVSRQMLLNKLHSLEDIIMLGYPSGLWDEKHNLPIIRKGTTASHPKLNYGGRDEFLIDAACFPGSSGSPVILANIGLYQDGSVMQSGARFSLLGVLYAGPQYSASGKITVVEVPTQATPIAVSNIPMNLGYVIKASKILDFNGIIDDARKYHLTLDSKC